MPGSSTAVKVDYGPHEAAMRAYPREGQERAMALGNRGPIRFDADGIPVSGPDDRRRRRGPGDRIQLPARRSGNAADPD